MALKEPLAIESKLAERHCDFWVARWAGPPPERSASSQRRQSSVIGTQPNAMSMLPPAATVSQAVGQRLMLVGLLGSS